MATHWSMWGPEAVVGRLADPLPRAKCEALGHTLGHVEEKVKSARGLTR